MILLLLLFGLTERAEFCPSISETIQFRTSFASTFLHEIPRSFLYKKTQTDRGPFYMLLQYEKNTSSHTSNNYKRFLISPLIFTLL
jgi:hypothetical protein